MAQPDKPMLDSMKDTISGNSSKIVAIVLGVGALGLYIWSYITASQFLGDKNGWLDVQAQMPTIMGTAITGGILSAIACSIYFAQMGESGYITYILIALSCLALCFSYVSIAIAVMTQSSK